jgi:hypothetical protein
MLFSFSTPELIRNMWQLKTAVFLHWCLICADCCSIEVVSTAKLAVLIFQLEPLNAFNCAAFVATMTEEKVL